MPLCFRFNFVIYLPKSMKTRKRFFRFVIVAAVIILLLVRFVAKWRSDVTEVPFMDVDIPFSFEHELVCSRQSRYIKFG